MEIPHKPLIAVTAICAMVMIPCLWSAPSAFAEPGCLIGLGDLPGGGLGSTSYDLSTNGVACGSSLSTGSTGGSTEAFMWSQGSGMTGLGEFPGGAFYSQAHALSGSGSVVVGYSNMSLGYEAFRWTPAGGMVGLGDIPGGDFYSCAYDISADGAVIVGYSYTASGTEPFRWTQGAGMIGLGPPGSTSGTAYAVSADGTVIVGKSGTQAFHWTSASGIVLLGDGESRDVSADGTIIVGQGPDSEAMRWTDSTGMIGLGYLPGGQSSIAYGVSADGSIVVGSSTVASELEVFIWDETHGMRNLEDVLENQYGVDLTGWDLDGAFGITPDGLRIVGDGKNSRGDTEAWLAYLPESVQCVAGDVNDDGLVDINDVDSFVGAILSPCWASSYELCAANINQDLSVDGQDLLSFVGLLLP